MIRVLVVDDVPDVRLGLHFMLLASGFDSIEAADGAAALKQVASQKVDVVLSDLIMPGMDGLTLIDAIRRWPAPRPAVIAMSGDPHLAYKANLYAARALGADAALVKPIAEPELRSLIHRLVGAGVALIPDRRPTEPGTGRQQRRSNPRTVDQNRATSIIQLFLKDINKATNALQRDLKDGASPTEVTELLRLVQALAWARGLDIRLRIEQVRLRLHELGYAV